MSAGLTEVTRKTIVPGEQKKKKKRKKGQLVMKEEEEGTRFGTAAHSCDTRAIM